MGHDHDNDFSFAYKNITLYYGRKTGYGGYGPPPNKMQRGSRIAVIKEGVRGLTETWIRQEDGSRMDLKACPAVESQGKCCGMASLSDILTPSVEGISTVSGDVNTVLPVVKKEFESKYETKPDKCQIYENEFRSAMKGNSFDAHAKVNRVVV